MTIDKNRYVNLEYELKKQQKYQQYHLLKRINMNILRVKNYYLLIEAK